MINATDSLQYWEDFPLESTRDFGPMQVTREAIIDFARQWDPQPFHLDDEAAAATHFGRLAASGWHTAAMTMRMVCDAWLLQSAGLGSPGLENLRWLKPVHAGDVLSGQITVLASRPSASKPGMGLLKTRWDTRNQHGVLVLSMESWAMFRRRTAADTPA
jgi:acyl dehydratase